MNRYILIPVIVLFSLGCEEAKDHDAIIGGHRFQLIESGGDFPTWSSDGGDIVFVDQGNLYLVPWSGGEPTRLTSLIGSELLPSCNPVSGKREVVFIHKPGTGDNFIYIMDLDNTDSLIEVYTSPRDLKDPSFTSDGSQIFFRNRTVPACGWSRSTGGVDEPVEIVNEIGWEQINYSKASPHSNTVLYIETRTGVYNLNRISVDGGIPEPLTTFTGKEYPVFRILAAVESYDGSRKALSIAYSDPYFRNTLWTIPSSGTVTYTQISEVKDGQTGYPAWSPDGSKIAVRMGNFFYVIELN